MRQYLKAVPILMTLILLLALLPACDFLEDTLSEEEQEDIEKFLERPVKYELARVDQLQSITVHFPATDIKLDGLSMGCDYYTDCDRSEDWNIQIQFPEYSYLQFELHAPCCFFTGEKVKFTAVNDASWAPEGLGIDENYYAKYRISPPEGFGQPRAEYVDWQEGDFPPRHAPWRRR